MQKQYPVIHFEMPYEDKDRVAEFYSRVFGWKTEKLDAQMNDYVVAQTTESDHLNRAKHPGTINGGFFPKKPEWPAQYPSVVIGVDNIESAMESIRGHGGTVLGEPMEIPGVGLYVSFFDTENNRCSILQAFGQ